MDLEHDVIRAGKVRELLDNEILKESFTEVRGIFIEEMLIPKIRKKEMQYWKRMVNSLDMLRALLEKHIDNGIIAQHDLKHNKKQAKRG